MSDDIHTQPTVPTTDERPVVAAAQPAVVEPVVVEQAASNRRSGFGSFLAGFIAAIVVAAIAFVVFLAVSDSDDDGNIQVDVPAVDVGG